MNLILAALMQQFWAMEVGAFERVLDVLTRHAEGVRLAGIEVQTIVGAAPAQAADRRQAAQASGGGVAVIPVYGTIAHRAHMVTQVSGSGGTSTELLGRAVRAAAADPSIAAIVLDVDSPGGAVDGTPEVVDAIFEARGAKPVVAVANSMAASAAYWIASAASELVMTPSGTVGSVGVMAARRYTDDATDPRSGMKVEVIHAGKYKAETMMPGPLGDDARAHLQAMVDHHYSVMTRSIARNRGVTAELVRAQYGQGRAFTADEAHSRGMIDRIDTLEATIDRMSNPRRRSRMKSNANALALASL